MGFVDGEGSFFITKQGSTYKLKFALALNIRDMDVLKKLQANFGFGSLHISKSNDSATWSVGSKEGIKTLAIFFTKHKLRTKKLRDFLLWKRSIDASNLERKKAQSLIRLLKDRPFPTQSPITSNWLVGFLEGEGCFFIELSTRRLKTKPDRRVECSITIIQKEERILNKIKGFLGGKVYKNTLGRFRFKIVAYKGVIPFNLNSKIFLLESKKIEFLNWKKIANMVAKKEHLTPEGYEEIKNLRSKMYLYKKVKLASETKR